MGNPVKERIHDRDDAPDDTGHPVVRQESVAMEVHDVGPADVGPEEGRIVAEVDGRSISADRDPVDGSPRGKGVATQPARGRVDDDFMSPSHEVSGEAEEVRFGSTLLRIEVRNDMVDIHAVLESGALGPKRERGRPRHVARA